VLCLLQLQRGETEVIGHARQQLLVWDIAQYVQRRTAIPHMWTAGPEARWLVQVTQVLNGRPSCFLYQQVTP
jgi:hypothetical protein